MVEFKKLSKKAEKAQIIISAMAKIDEEIFKRASCLRLIQQWGTGLDGEDIISATSYQVAIANVPVTPHIAGLTDVSYRGIATKIAENIGWVLEGKLPLNYFNPDLTFY